MRIVLATTNTGKIRELAEVLGHTGCEVLGLRDFPEIGAIAETGSSFAENAIEKARHVALRTGFVAVADDSGLVVPALDGRPGIFSARFADDLPPLSGETRDQRNIRKLLAQMEGKTDRAAHFETAMAAVAPNGAELLVHGRWAGYILTAPRGSNGFGYDPVFFDPELGGSAAELGVDEKNRVSHRGRAARALLAAWPEFAEKAQMGS